MAKRKSEEVGEQLDLFPGRPMVAGLGVTSFSVKGGALSASLEGVANVNDVARLTDEAWRNGAASWFLGLCKNDIAMASRVLNDAWVEIDAQITARKSDEAIGYARTPGKSETH